MILTLQPIPKLNLNMNLNTENVESAAPPPATTTTSRFYLIPE